jgi:hypothetical protein
MESPESDARIMMMELRGSGLGLRVADVGGRTDAPVQPLKLRYTFILPYYLDLPHSLHYNRAKSDATQPAPVYFGIAFFWPGSAVGEAREKPPNPVGVYPFLSGSALF